MDCESLWPGSGRSSARMSVASAAAKPKAFARVQAGQEDGSGTVLIVGAGLGIILLMLAVLGLLQAAVGGSRAGTAADMAALAGADTIRGLRTGDPCTVAAEVAARNGAELASCVPEAGTLSVLVKVRAEAGALLPWPPTASARAGPPG